jgi:hypothetical protein
MALNAREKRLAAVVGVLGVAMLLWLVVGRVAEAFRTRQSQLDALTREVQQKQFRMAAMGLTLERYADWESRALPRDRELARSLYQNWLVKTLADAKLDNVQVDPGRPLELRDVYLKLPFTVRAQGSTTEIVGWLASFYKADHLQQLRELSLQPIGKAGDLQLTATIEALSLPEANRTDKLTELAGGRLSADSAKTATKTIVDRNLFAAYVPPPPPKPPAPVVKTTPPPPKPKFDEAKYTFLTSVVAADDALEAGLTVRPTKQLLKLRTGDDIQVGQFAGTLVRIGAKEIEVEQDGKRRVIALGKSLGETADVAVGDL